ncbi:Mitogen-activated protein kinase-binding protein 1 [Tetrabaena socialis]|uniref:Mitogen-activated protein kinase-binding protein 1 n=1 Tax=Tetrabaena socialis TaxID=47790 RepID=A0A2J8AK90_9CHLO|nr:Mitogen-activated protein kinase-binding protein 1 [Tetrabaena socialis]|eukprot:PNH12931.1 Mitogen-activated protein kinase-binding protein 1 [Tetrabaena socialis]
MLDAALAPLLNTLLALKLRGPTFVDQLVYARSCGVQAWTLAVPTRARDAFMGGQASLTARPVNLKEFRSAAFVAVASAPPEAPAQQQPALLYALTSAGVLVTVRPATRCIDKSVSLQAPAAFGLAVSPTLVACACSSGIVRLFSTKTLAFKGNLPRPAARGATGAPETLGAAAPCAGAAGPGRSTLAGPPSAAAPGPYFPDALRCGFDSSGERLTVVYSDRSLLVWDVRDPGKALRARSILSHSGIIWGLALVPPWQAALLGPAPASAAPTPGGGGVGTGAQGSTSVLCTCGADGTIRLWNVCLDSPAGGAPPSAAAAAAAAQRRCGPDAPLRPPGGAAPGAPPPAVTLRCLRVSPCGRHLAAGDSRGNLRIYDLATFRLLLAKEAHDAEILSLDYSPPALDGSCYLASGSRDMLVHVYDTAAGYELAGTCEAHGAAVTAVRFSSSGSRLALLSCSADRSVVFRHVQTAGGGAGLVFDPYRTERGSRAVLYDLAVDATGGRAVAVGQDGQLRLFDVATGRAIRSFAGDPSCGEAVAVVMDPTGHLAVCSCADGAVAIYDLDAACLVARAAGHGDVCTGAVLLEDYRGLITVGGDGCALLWRLTPRLARRMQEAAAQCQKHMEQQAAAQTALRQHAAATPAAVHVDMSATILRVREGKPLLSVDKLPRWAQRQHAPDPDDGARLGPGGGSQLGDNQQGGNGAAAPAGKWAQRMAAAPAPAGAVPAATAGPVAGGGAAAAGPGFVPTDAAAVAAAAAGRDGAVAEQHRAWADEVEDEDEIVLCGSEEEEEEAGLRASALAGRACRAPVRAAARKE